jgi:hypothetical protein
MTEFEYNTTLNGGIITVVMNIEHDFDEDGESIHTSLDAVYYDCTDVTGILSKEQLTALEMEAEAAMSDYSFEQRNV